MEGRGAAVASTLTDIKDQESRLANAGNLALGAKVTLSIIVGSDNLRRELGTFCYILTGLFGYACPYIHKIRGVVECTASNRGTFKRSVLTSHQATDLLNNISGLLSEYLNACVHASCTAGLAQPGYLTPVSFRHLHDGLRFLPYHGPARLHPTLQYLI